MLSVRVETVGLAELRARFLDLGGETRSALRREMLAIGQDVATLAKARAPVLQKARKKRSVGELRDSIKPRLDETDTSLSVKVKPGKFWGIFMESGVVSYGRGRTNKRATTKLHRLQQRLDAKAAGAWRISPRPFMAPARAEVEPTARERLQAAAESVL